MKKSNKIGRYCVLRTGFTTHQLRSFKPFFRFPAQYSRIIIFKLIQLAIARLHNTQNDVAKRSGTKWANQIELLCRDSGEIQLVYDALETAKVYLVADIELYIDVLCDATHMIHNFNKANRHRERKANLYSNRQNAKSQITNNTLGKNSLQDQVGIQLAHNTSKSSRRDASLNSTMRGPPPLPQKSLQRKIAQSAVLVRVDEFRTSKMCSVCHIEPAYIDEQQNFVNCTHKKKRMRVPIINENQQGVLGVAAIRRSREKKKCCVDEDNNFIGLSTECPDRVDQHFPLPIYPVKMCEPCSRAKMAAMVASEAVDEEDEFFYWGRDVNASRNIRHIMDEYIQSGCNIDSRPDYLRRDK